MSDYLYQQAVCDVLQEVYGDATQTEFDRRAADQILLALRARGWAAPADVALLVSSAGGRITVTDKAKMAISESGWQLRTWDDPATLATVVEVR